MMLGVHYSAGLLFWCWSTLQKHVHQLDSQKIMQSAPVKTEIVAPSVMYMYVQPYLFICSPVQCSMLDSMQKKKLQRVASQVVK